MFINYWIVIVLLAALVSYFFEESRRHKREAVRFKKALEQIRAHGETPVVDWTEPAADQARAYRLAFSILTSIARRALR